MNGSKQFGNAILYRVGILVLINQHILEFMLILMQYIRKPLQQFIHFQQQIIKVHRTVFKATLAVGCVYFSDLRFFCTGVFLLNIAVLRIIFRIDEGIFGGRNARPYSGWLILFLIQPQLFCYGFNYRSAIVGIVNGKVGGISQVPGFCP